MAAERIVNNEWMPNLSPGFNVQEVRVAGNRGTCGGVNMSLAVVKQIMEIVPCDIDVWTTNTPVNFPPAFAQYGERLKVADADLATVPDRSVLIVSAHGSPPDVFDKAKRKDLFVIDTTCHFVKKEQEEVRKTAAAGIPIIYLGEENHPETRGIQGQVKKEEIMVFNPNTPIPEDALIPDGAKLFVKTTNDPEKNIQRASELQKRAEIDISRILPCYALNGRYAAGKPLAQNVDFWLVVGDKTSNNARGLKALATTDTRIIPSALVASPEEINWSDFTPEIKIVGVTAAASAPEEFTQRVLDVFRHLGINVVELPKVIRENPTIFRLPKEQLEALKQRFR